MYPYKNGLKFLSILLVLLTFSCKKELTNEYELNPVQLENSSGNKTNLKSDLQFISIAYSDLFGKQIGSVQLNKLINGYASIGDKALIIDRIILNFLNSPGVLIPSNTEMRANPDGFISAAFNKLLVREPSEMEIWFLKNIINANNSISAGHIYYVIMTSNEYRFY